MTQYELNKLIFDFYSGRRDEVQSKVVKLSNDDIWKLRKLWKHDTVLISLLIDNK